MAPPERKVRIVANLTSALNGVRYSAVDLSDALATVSVSGPGARETLAKCCPLDLHPRVFEAGDCARSVCAKADILIFQVDDEPTYHLTTTASFAEYLWLWLEDAAAEYGCVVVEG